MIGIKHNGVFWDMKPGATAEIERRSPFFAINDITMEASTPVTFTYSRVNVQQADYYFNYYTSRVKKKIAASLYDGNMYRCQCTLIIESAQLDLNNTEACELTGYLLFGISNFFQVIKDKKLKDLLLGGLRTFNWTTNNPNDNTNGFWQHLHATWTDATIPYVFAPVRNENYLGENGPDFMNKLGDNGKLKDEYNNPLVPMIRKKYLLEQIFKEHGFEVDFSGINDSEWEKLIDVSVVGIDWQTLTFSMDGNGAPFNGYDHKPVISFSLNKHVPQDELVSNYLIQFFNRYGIAPVFDIGSRRCRMVAVKELGKKTPLDWTGYAFAGMTSSFNQDKRVFKFENEIDSNDELPSAPDFNNRKFREAAYTVRYLTDPLPEEAESLRYCYSENAWYEAKLNETTNLYQWAFFADNIYSQDVNVSTESITTTMSTLPVQLTQYRTAGGINYYGFFAAMKHSSRKSFGFRTLLYHGLVYELTDIGGQGLIRYPYASSIRTDPLGTTSLAWSNVWNHKLYEGSDFEADFGIVAYWWKNFLTYISKGEDVEVMLRLPMHVIQSFVWDDVIMIKQVRYLVMTVVEQLPFKGIVKATLKRLNKLSEVAAAVVIVPPDVTVYAKLQVINIKNNPDTTTWNDSEIGDIQILLYTDAAGTIGYTPTTPLTVHVKTILTVNGPTIQDIAIIDFTITLASSIVWTDAFINGTNNMTSSRYEKAYSLTIDLDGKYVVI